MTVNLAKEIIQRVGDQLHSGLTVGAAMTIVEAMSEAQLALFLNELRKADKAEVEVETETVSELLTVVLPGGFMCQLSLAQKNKSAEFFFKNEEYQESMVILNKTNRKGKEARRLFELRTNLYYTSMEWYLRNTLHPDMAQALVDEITR